MIVLDLEELDLLRQETSIHTDMMAKLQSQVLLQHNVISAKDSKIENLNKIIKEKDVLIEISEKEKTVLKSKIKKSYLIGALSGGAISTLLFLLR